jgi:hypothetical protein
MYKYPSLGVCKLRVATRQDFGTVLPSWFGKNLTKQLIAEGRKHAPEQKKSFASDPGAGQNITLVGADNQHWKRRSAILTSA